MENRNILIAYFLAYLRTSWFWLGIWVFYYLRYTNYAGIGLIESVLIITMTLTEIPTGAIADLLGRKLTLTLSFFLGAFCNFYMGLAPNYSALVMAVFFGAIGNSLYSGAYESLLFDTLKEKGKQERFDKVIANTNTLSLIAMAVSGSLGGFMYTLNPSLPFFAVGLAYSLGFFLTWLLKEPTIDTEKFSWKNFLFQNKQGLVMLKKLVQVERLALLILAVSALYVISDEMLESVLGVEFGFSEKQLGVFFAVVFLVAAAASQLAPTIRKIIGINRGVILVTTIMAATYMLSPLAGIFLGGITIILRESSSRILQNFTSVAFNRHIESKYRATTLSTYNMFKNIPYILSAYLLGSLMDLITAKNFAFLLGITILLLIFWQLIKTRSSAKPAFA